MSDEQDKAQAKTDLIGIRVSPEERAEYEAAADADDRPVSQWIRAVLNREIRRLKRAASDQD